MTEIVDLVVRRRGLTDVKYGYAGWPRGRKGDVPAVRFRSDKLERHGWLCRRGSRQALIASIDAQNGEASREVVA